MGVDGDTILRYRWRMRKNKQLNIQAPEHSIIAWKAAAKAAGLSLSEWMRFQLDAAVERRNRVVAA